VTSNSVPSIKDEYVAYSRYGPTRTPGKYSLHVVVVSSPVSETKDEEAPSRVA
jgi:hypothetical protein